jgi:hypothetical protein
LLEGTIYLEPRYITRDKKYRTYVFDEETKKAKVDPETKKYATKDVEESTFEGGEITMIPFTDCYPPDNAGTIREWEECDKIIVRRYTYAELKRKEGNGGWTNIDEELLTHKTKTRQKSPGEESVGAEVTGKEVIECLECHVTFPIAAMTDMDDNEKERTNWEEERIVVTIARESQIMIRFRKNIDLCFSNDSIVKRVRLHGNDDETYGYPIYSKMKSVQRGASNFFNRFMDMTTIIMIPWYFYKKGRGVEGQQTLYPGKGVAVDDPKSITFPRFNFSPGEFAFVNDMFKELWSRIASIDDAQLGKPSKEGSTATEILSILQEGNIQHDHKSKGFKEEMIVLLSALYDMYYQWMPDSKTIMFKNQEVQFPREAMQQFKMFRLTGSSANANSLIERREAEDLSNMITANPVFSGMSNPVAFFEDLLRTYGKDNTDRYLDPVIGSIMQLYQADPDGVKQALTQVAQMIQQNMEGANAGNVPQ